VETLWKDFEGKAVGLPPSPRPPKGNTTRELGEMVREGDSVEVEEWEREGLGEFELHGEGLGVSVPSLLRAGEREEEGVTEGEGVKVPAAAPKKASAELEIERVPQAGPGCKVAELQRVGERVAHCVMDRVTVREIVEDTLRDAALVGEPVKEGVRDGLGVGEGEKLPPPPPPPPPPSPMVEEGVWEGEGETVFKKDGE